MSAPPTYHSICFLHRHEIDDERWNACLENAVNSSIYAHTIFLDCMCPGWCALVQGDYEAIMPLPQRKKWGIAYLFQPFQTPVLGVFSSNAETNTDVFLQAIPPHFWLWDISLNTGNKTSRYGQFVIPRQNYVLHLNPTYTQIQSAYHQQRRRSLQKANKAGLIVNRAVPPNAILQLSQQHYPSFTRVSPGNFAQIERLCGQMSHNIQCYGVYDSNSILLASAIFLRMKNRAYYWMVGNDARGRQNGASALLLDAFIRDHAGTNTLLDFEGSEVPGVAAFYRSFGAQSEPYQCLYYNRLPFPFRMLKKMPAHYRHLLSLQQ